ncbi:MAG: response regulator, partial [Ruminococcus sp.]|nr:response regulator [Ruminococcus sp.]
KIDMTAVHIAIQQLVALLGVFYIVALILMFIYEKGNIASSKLQEKEQEEIYRKKLQKTVDVMQALSRDYEVVLNMDLEADTVTMYSCSEKMANVVDDESLRKPFYEAGEQFYRRVACDEDLPELLELTTREKIDGYLKENHIFSHVFKSKDGRYGETKIVPISEHEFVCGYTDVDNVIREKMKQQEKLEKAMREAEAASKAKSAFLLNMSHDIRTPMNAIIGYTDILAKYRQDEKEFERCTGNIRASGKYLLELINNVLEMARIESGAQTVNIAPCDARTILGRTYIVFKEEAEKKGITLTYDRDVQHNFLYADKVKIQEIHLNIISNAVKYTKPGGTVRIFSQEIPDEREGWCKVRTTTTDTGIGMSQEYVEHIFDDFSRENNSTTSGVSGTGLGMGIVKKLVDMLGATIEIHSEKGKGTSVTVVMPHRIAEESQVEKDDDAQVIDDSLLKGRRVLLAEDNDLNADIAEELLGDVGLLVERASDGIICVSKLETAQAGYYDLILMDVQMPNMDGYQATRII